jgi:hypothetical protein
MSKTSLQPAPQGAGTAGTVGTERPQTLGTRVHDILHSNATLGPLFVLLLAVVYFSITADRFLAPANPSGKTFINTGVTLVTDKPVGGVASKDTTFGLANCWG